MMKYAELLKKFKGKNLIYLLILTAVLLLLFSGGKVTENKNSEIVKQENNYYEEISVRLENILSKIRGAGDVSVMFVLENNGEVIPVFNKKISSDVGNQRNETESTAVLYGQGSNEQPYISQEKNPEVSGIIVVAEGADNENVKIEIFEAVRALLGVPANRIKVSASIK